MESTPNQTTTTLTPNETTTTSISTTTPILGPVAASTDLNIIFNEDELKLFNKINSSKFDTVRYYLSIASIVSCIGVPLIISSIIIYKNKELPIVVTILTLLLSLLCFILGIVNIVLANNFQDKLLDLYIKKTVNTDISYENIKAKFSSTEHFKSKCGVECQLRRKQKRIEKLARADIVKNNYYDIYNGRFDMTKIHNDIKQLGIIQIIVSIIVFICYLIFLNTYGY
jgi:hypothetical protein